MSDRVVVAEYCFGGLNSCTFIVADGKLQFLSSAQPLTMVIVNYLREVAEKAYPKLRTIFIGSKR